MEQVEKFQTAAKKLLSKNVEDVEELNKVIETGSGLDVDLPELEELKQKSKQVCTKFVKIPTILSRHSLLCCY